MSGDFSENLERGQEAFDEGRFEDAHAALTAALDSYRSHPAALAIYAETCLKLDKTEEAHGALRRLAVLRPDRPQVLSRLAMVEAGMSMPVQARAHVFQALRLQFRALGGKLGYLLLSPWRWALAAAGAAFGRWPSPAVARQAQAAQRALRRRRFNEAAGFAAAALDRAPEHPATLQLHGGAMLEINKKIAAIESLEKAAALAGDNPAVIADYARVLSADGRYDEALEQLSRLTEEQCQSAEVLRVYGQAYLAGSDAGEALRHFEESLRRRPRHVPTGLAYAQCLAALGRREEAVGQLHRLQRRDPGNARIYYMLANLRAIDPDGSLASKMRRLAARPEIDQQERRRLEFALARLLHENKRYDEAFAHLERANMLKSVTYDRAAVDAEFEETKQAFSPSLFRSGHGSGRKEAPIFIVGLPRSGTSLAEQILASHPEIFGVGESEAINRIVYRLKKDLAGDGGFPAGIEKISPEMLDELAAYYLASVGRANPGKPLTVDKMPGNFFRLGLIALLFPNARIVHCRRNAMDVCLSNYQHDFEGFHPYIYDLGNMAHYYRRYLDLMAYWHEVLPLPIFDLDYERVVDETEETVRRLLAFLDLDFDPACLDFHRTERTVATSSATQVRERIYRSAVGGWKRYEKHLTGLREQLERPLQHG